VLTIGSVTGFEFRARAVKLTSEPVNPDAEHWATNGSLYMSPSNTAELVGHVAIARDQRLANDLPAKLARRVSGTKMTGGPLDEAGLPVVLIR
jgi:hypothetical protein